VGLFKVGSGSWLLILSLRRMALYGTVQRGLSHRNLCLETVYENVTKMQVQFRWRPRIVMPMG
jgi:hypothetical protein